MSDRKALLRGVIDSPDDDAPRLVMADWYEENGEPDRAEFIRLQVELAREDVETAEEPLPLLTRLRSYRVGSADRQRRIERTRELFAAHRSEWESDVAAWARRGAADFCRGFISHLHTTVNQWLKGAAGLHRSAPVTDLSLTKPTGLVGKLAACPQFANVSSLILLGPVLQPEEAAALRGSPHLGRLRSLRLILAGPEAELQTLLTTPWPGLLGLHLDNCAVADAQVRTLADNPASRSLEKLVITGGTISAAGAEALVNSPHLGHLAYVYLAHNPVGDTGALSLVRAPSLPALAHLYLWDCGVTAQGAVALAADPRLARLRHLDLSGSELGDAGAAALAASPHLCGLRELALRTSNVTDAGALALANSPHLGGLRRLWLAGNNAIGPEARARLRQRFSTDLPA